MIDDGTCEEPLSDPSLAGSAPTVEIAVSASSPGVRVKGITAVTPHNRALYEAGKEILIGSVAAGVEFCKFMIGVATGSIAAYIAILNLVLSPNRVLSGWEKGAALVPVAFLLASMLLF